MPLSRPSSLLNWTLSICSTSNWKKSTVKPVRSLYCIEPKEPSHYKCWIFFFFLFLSTFFKLVISEVKTLWNCIWKLRTSFDFTWNTWSTEVLCLVICTTVLIFVLFFPLLPLVALTKQVCSEVAGLVAFFPTFSVWSSDDSVLVGLTE